MRIFVTGATGFIGLSVAKELISAGHEVLGLARSDTGEKALAAIGADIRRGSLEDTAGLQEAAAGSDAVIHLAFIHDWSKMAESCAVDRRAIEALGSSLAGSDKPLIVTAGTAGLAAPGHIATENSDVPRDFPFPRVSEQTALSLKNVRASVMRLPQVHDTERQGLVSYAVAVAREKGVSAYVGDGGNRWAAAHVSDVARLYRLALEKHEAGARYHAVAEEGVPMRDIAQTIGRSLKGPGKALSAEQAAAHFGWLAMFIDKDLMASSNETRRKLGWNPTGPGLISDLEHLTGAGPTG
jgi:nucleoside-diphosphate-sugar epimerase